MLSHYFHETLTTFSNLNKYVYIISWLIHSFIQIAFTELSQLLLGFLDLKINSIVLPLGYSEACGEEKTIKWMDFIWLKECNRSIASTGSIRHRGRVWKTSEKPYSAYRRRKEKPCQGKKRRMAFWGKGRNHLCSEEDCFAVEIPGLRERQKDQIFPMGWMMWGINYPSCGYWARCCHILKWLKRSKT